MSRDHRKSSLVIGPRTHKDILKGKNIRKQADGCDVFEDYWTDSDHDSTESTISPTKSDPQEVVSVDLPNNKNDIENDNTTYGCFNTRLQTSKLKGSKADSVVSKSPNKTEVIRTETLNILSRFADKSNLNNSSCMTLRHTKSPTKKQKLADENLQSEINPCTKSFNKETVLNSPVTSKHSEPTTSISNAVEDDSIESTGHLVSLRPRNSPAKKQKLAHKNSQPEIDPCTKSFNNEIVLNGSITGKQGEPTTSISNAVEDDSLESTRHLVSLRPRNSPAKKQKLTHENLQPEVLVNCSVVLESCPYTKSFVNKTVVLNSPIASEQSGPTTSISNAVEDLSVESSGHLISLGPRNSPAKKPNLTQENLQPEVLESCPYTESFGNKTVVLSSPVISEQRGPTTNISNAVENVSVESSGHLISLRPRNSPAKKPKLTHENLQPEVLEPCPYTKSFVNKTVVLNSHVTSEQSEPTTNVSNANANASVESSGLISLRPRNSPAKKPKLTHENLQPEVLEPCPYTKSFVNKTVVLNSPVTSEQSEPTTSVSNANADASVESIRHLARELEIDNVNSLSKNTYISTTLGPEQVLKINECILEKSNKRKSMKNSPDMEKNLSRYDEFDLEIMQRVLENQNTQENHASQHTHIETVPVKNKTINVDKSIRRHKVNSRSSISKKKNSSHVSLHKHNSQFENEVTSLSRKNLQNSSDQVAEKVKYIHKKCTENTDNNCENPDENNSDNYENYIESKKSSKKIHSPKKKNDLKIKSNQHSLTSHKKVVKKRKNSLTQKSSETFSKNTRKRAMDHEVEPCDAVTSGIENEECLANISDISLCNDNDLDLHQSLNAKRNPVATCSSSIDSNKMLKKNPKGKKENCGIQIRRSSRQRYAPLASWRNQRLLYRFENKEIKILGVDEGTKEDDNALKQLHNAEIKRIKSQKLKKNKPKKANKLKVVVENKKLSLEVLKKFDSVPWENGYEGSYTLKRAHETINFAFGFLEIEKNKMKPTQYSPDEDVHFTVMKGKLEINAQDHIFELEDRDMFMVPRKTPYSLKNIGNIKALIHFVVGKFHFIESQDL